MRGSITFLVCFAAAMGASAVAARTNGVMVASHRADWRFAPENSLESLKNAIRFGADIIETDVRMTKDCHIVIMHDYAVNRTTNGNGYIGDLTLDEIRTLRLRDNLGAMTQYQVPNPRFDTISESQRRSRNERHHLSIHGQGSYRGRSFAEGRFVPTAPLDEVESAIEVELTK